MITLNSSEIQKIQLIADNIRGLKFNLESVANDFKERHQNVLNSDYENNRVEIMNVHFLINLINEKASDLERVTTSIERLLLK